MSRTTCRGDARFRSSYSRHLQQLLPQGHPAIEQIVDIGCATGLSSCELLRAFPQAHVTGIDLSPHFLAVGLHLHPEAQVPVRVVFLQAAQKQLCIN